MSHFGIKYIYISKGGGVNLVCRFSSHCLLRLLAAASTYQNIYLRSCQAASGGKLERKRFILFTKEISPVSAA